MGSGYTVEGQVTGEEKFGGIQIEVTPSYRRRGYSFWHMSGYAKSPILEDSTLRERKLEGCSTIYMKLRRSCPAMLSDFFESRELLAEIDCLALKAIMPATRQHSHSQMRRQVVFQVCRVLYEIANPYLLAGRSQQGSRMRLCVPRPETTARARIDAPGCDVSK